MQRAGESDRDYAIAMNGFMGEVMYDSELLAKQKQREEETKVAATKARIDWLRKQLPFVSVEALAYKLEIEQLEKELSDLKQ